MSTLHLRTLAISASVAILGGCAAARKPSAAATPAFTPDSNFEKAWPTVSVVGNHPIIDVHTHAFNARYLPLKRVVAARKWGTGIWFLPGLWIEAAAVFITSSTPMNEVEAADRKRRLVDWERKHGPANTDGKQLTAILDTNNQSLQVVWPGSKNAKINKLKHASPSERTDLAIGIRGTAKEISPSGWIAYHLFLKWSLRQVVGVLFSHDAAHVGNREYLAGTLVSLMSSDTEVRERMAKAFPSVDLFVYQNMDLVPSFYRGRGEGTYAMSYSNENLCESSSLPRIRTMCADSNGRMIHFVAWNPFRTLDDPIVPKDRTSLAIVKRAVANGAKGVKFYPPLGCRPSGNDFSEIPKPLGREARKQWQHRYGGHDGKHLDNINEELFAYCEQNDIPIFTHCNTGEFRAYDDVAYAEMAHPKYWIPVLNRHPNLRLCFGHAGGVTDWYQGFGGIPEKVKGEASWGVIVRDLCRKYRNVYCEFGIHEGVANAKPVEPFYHTLLVELPSKNLSNGERGDYPLAEKVMYGSDYYMPINCSPQKYLEGFQKLFSLDGMGDYKKKFLYQNAEKYLKRSVANRWRAR